MEGRPTRSAALFDGHIGGENPRLYQDRDNSRGGSLRVPRALSMRTTGQEQRLSSVGKVIWFEHADPDQSPGRALVPTRRKEAAPEAPSGRPRWPHAPAVPQPGKEDKAATWGQTGACPTQSNLECGAREDGGTEEAGSPRGASAGLGSSLLGTRLTSVCLSWEAMRERTGHSALLPSSGKPGDAGLDGPGLQAQWAPGAADPRTTSFSSSESNPSPSPRPVWDVPSVCPSHGLDRRKERVSEPLLPRDGGPAGVAHRSCGVTTTRASSRGCSCAGQLPARVPSANQGKLQQSPRLVGRPRTGDTPLQHHARGFCGGREPPPPPARRCSGAGAATQPQTMSPWPGGIPGGEHLTSWTDT